MNNKKKEDLKYCFRYHCKGCPKERACDQSLKGFVNEKKKKKKKNCRLAK